MSVNGSKEGQKQQRGVGINRLIGPWKTGSNEREKKGNAVPSMTCYRSKEQLTKLYNRECKGVEQANEQISSSLDDNSNNNFHENLGDIKRGGAGGGEEDALHRYTPWAVQYEKLHQLRGLP